MDKKLITALTRFSLTEQEAVVYVAALQNGPGSVLNISRISGIKRTTTYTILESLRAKSLIDIQFYGFKKKWIAAPPETLESILIQRRDELKQILPALNGLQKLEEGESQIKFFPGINRIKEIYEGLLADIGRNQDYMIISAMQQWYDLAPEYFEDFTRRRAALSKKLNFRIRLLAQDTPVSRRHHSIQRELNEVIRFLPKKTKLPTNLVVIPKKVVIHQLVEPIHALVIENPHIVQMHQQLFEILWEQTTN